MPTALQIEADHALMIVSAFGAIFSLWGTVWAVNCAKKIFTAFFDDR